MVTGNQKISKNVNIAYQVRDTLENYETAMSLRELPETEIYLYFRNDEFQKFHYRDISYNLIGNTEEDEEFEGIPEDVYSNLCKLIHNEIKGLNMELNHRTIVIGWKYDHAQEAFTELSFSLQKEVHFGRLWKSSPAALN